MSEHNITVNQPEVISDGYWVECDCGWSSFTLDTKVEALAEGARHFRADYCPPHGIPRPYMGSHLCAGCGERFHPSSAADTVCFSCARERGTG